jgi:hypothetical protein
MKDLTQIQYHLIKNYQKESYTINQYKTNNAQSWCQIVLKWIPKVKLILK